MPDPHFLVLSGELTCEWWEYEGEWWTIDGVDLGTAILDRFGPGHRKDIIGHDPDEHEYHTVTHLGRVHLLVVKASDPDLGSNQPVLDSVDEDELVSG